MWKKVDRKLDSLIGKRVKDTRDGSEYEVVKFYGNNDTYDMVLDCPGNYYHGTNATVSWSTVLDHFEYRVEGSINSVSNIEREEQQPEPKPYVRKRDCYLDGHEFVDTGMTKSWCKHCDADAEWDGAKGRFDVKRTGRLLAFSNEDFEEAYKDLANFIVKACTK